MTRVGAGMEDRAGEDPGRAADESPSARSTRAPRTTDIRNGLGVVYAEPLRLLLARVRRGP